MRSTICFPLSMGSCVTSPPATFFTSGLQRVPWPLVKEVAGGDVAQLPIYNGKQIVERIAVAVAPGEE